jgi:hypothetical protein
MDRSLNPLLRWGLPGLVWPVFHTAPRVPASQRPGFGIAAGAGGGKRGRPFSGSLTGITRLSQHLSRWRRTQS